MNTGILELEERLKALELPECRFMEPLSLHTTFRIGGPARAFVSPGDEAGLRACIGLCRQLQVPYALLGNGSNLLAGDKGYKGVVISLEKGWSFCCREEGNCLRAGGGALLGRTARMALAEGLTGMEFAAGIPGTLGGALVMNAGAYGSEMKDILTEARVMTQEGEILVLTGEELALGYRSSCIPARGYVVLEALLQLKPGDAADIQSRMDDLSARRREKQPLEYPSAGSTFKRPEGHFAGKLIEDAGLRGYQIGGAQVSEKHCGFVINRGGATAADVLALCSYVSGQVRQRFGVELEMEIKKLGEF